MSKTVDLLYQGNSSLKLTDGELIAVYAALTHSVVVCDIFIDQVKPIKNGAEAALDKVTALMEERKLLEEDKHDKS